LGQREQPNDVGLWTSWFCQETDKVSPKEIEKAEQIRIEYFEREKKMKSYTLDKAQDLLIGKIGTSRSDQYEFELKLELVGDMIKTARKECHLTQEQLGELIGVRKSQISKFENHAKNVTIETILKVIQALKAKINFKVELLNNDPNIA
jgi:DNA-binding XRE family transcriptional regulator